MASNRKSQQLPLTEQQKELALLKMRGATAKEISQKLGIKLSTVNAWSRSEKVRSFIAEHSEAVNRELALKSSDDLSKLGITRVNGLRRLWELTHMPSTDTSSQLAALLLVFEAMGWDRVANEDTSASGGGRCQ